MADEILNMTEAREGLSQIIDGFQAGNTKPVFVGAHRKPEVVIVPVAVYEDLMAAVRQQAMLEALGSVRASGGEPAPEVHEITKQWIVGAIPTAEMRARVRALYGMEENGQPGTARMAARRHNRLLA